MVAFVTKTEIARRLCVHPESKILQDLVATGYLIAGRQHLDLFPLEVVENLKAKLNKPE